MKQEEKSKLSKTAIIKASISEIGKSGKAEIPLNKICRENNISKGKLYHYFSSKQEVLYACINYSLTELAESINAFQPASTDSIFNNLHNYYKQRIEYWMENPNNFIVLQLALETLSEEDSVPINECRFEYYTAVKEKTLQIVQSEAHKINISQEDLYMVMQTVYENMFMFNVSKIVKAIKQNDILLAKKRQEALLSRYDNLIRVMLYGILVNP